MPAATWRSVPIEGVAGVPATGVSAVAVSFTVLAPAAAGELHADIGGGTSTDVTYLDWNAGETISAAGVLPVASDGTISVFASTATDLLVDVQGYYSAGSVTAPGGYVAVPAAAIVDTSTGLGVSKKKVATGGSLSLHVDDLSGIPDSASSVMLNFVIFNNTSAASITPFPSGQPRPTTALSAPAGQSTTVSAAVDLASNARLSIYVDSGGPLDIAVQIEGYFTATTNGVGSFTPGAARAYDSRVAPATSIAAGATQTVPLAGSNGVPQMSTGITAVATAVTVIPTSSTGSGQVFPDDGTGSPNLVYFSGSNVSTDFMVVTPGADGGIKFTNNGSGPVDIVIDVEGWYTSTPLPPPPPPPAPVVTVNGSNLDGMSLDATFTADLSDAAGITGTVTWQLDGTTVGTDSTAPYSWVVTTTTGAHTLTAKWTAPDVDSVDAAFTVGPYIKSDNKPLADGLVATPFTADLVNAAGVTGDVTWLLDDSFAGKDSTAPYSWTVTTTPGTHKLKARWVTTGTTTASVTATFTVTTNADWTPPKTVLETPGPALQNLWTTSDNRRAPIPGMYDWSKAGFGGGTILPTDADVRTDNPSCVISAAQMVSQFHVTPNDGVDDTDGIQSAIDQIKADCSPTGSYFAESRILLPAGTLNVSHEISLDADYLIFRGAGADPATGTHFVYAPDANTRYDKLTKDGTQWDEDAMTSGDAQGGWIWPGRGLFRVQSRQVATKYLTQYAAAPANRKDLFEGTVNDHWVSGLTLRSKPGDTGYAARKGDTTIYLDSAASFDQLEVGGLVNVMAANSKAFYSSMDADHDPSEEINDHMRQQVFMVTSGDPVNKTITIDKPLEYDLPIDSTSDGSTAIDGTVYASKVTPLVDAVVGVGIENLSFTQAEPSLKAANATQNYGNMDPAGAMNGIVFKWAANSWVKGIRSDMTGSHPIVTEVAANLSIVDNSLNGAWNKGKGGNGYFRGSRVWDSLYVGNTTRNLRHFTFQWSASGNVAIGNSFDSDINLHGGYERNNLIEDNQVSVPYDHKPDSCQSNCGEEGGGDPDDSDWYPIYWSTGQKAVKWSGSSGYNNVFFNNTLRKQLGNDTTAYTNYAPYGTNPHTIFQFGVDPSGNYHALDSGGTPIADWAHNETADYTDGHGVVNTKTDPTRSLFLKTISQTGYGGPHPQPLRRTWGCKCWDGRGNVNTRLAADPVNTGTGSMMENFTDLTLPGLGTPLAFTRTYNSMDPTEGPLGQGWTFAFNASATPGDDNTVMIRDDSGSQTQYQKQTDGTYKSLDPGVTATLTDRAGGGWILTNIDHAQIQFSPTGQELSDFDNQGHGVSALYSSGRLASVQDTLGQTLTFTYGTTGAANNRLTKVTGSDGRSVSFGFTAAGSSAHLTSVVDVTGKTTTYSYDTATGYLNGITDPLGHTSAQTVYDPTSGRVTQQTDATGGVWHFAWNATTQTATITDPTGAVSQDIYDGNVLISHVGPDGLSSELYYNSNNMPIDQTTPGQTDNRREYDANGNLTKQYVPTNPDDSSPAFDAWTYDSANRMTSHTDPEGNTTSYAYDTSGRLTTTTEPGGATTTLTYTSMGQVATSTDERGKTTTFGYDTDGNMTSQTSPNGEITTFTWDASHNKLSQTDPRGNVAGATATVKEQYTTHWTYDAAGRVLTTTDALDHVTTNTYDAAGNLLTVTAPNGGVTTYTYDDAGRQLTVTDDSGHVTTNAYNTAGQLISTTAADGGKTSYAYNDLDQMVSQTDPIGNASGASAETKRQHTTSYVYDANGNQTQQRTVDPNQPDHDLVTTTTYDQQNRPIAVTDPADNTTTTTYDLNGRPIKVTDPDGVVSSTTYNAQGRVASTTKGGTTTTNTYDAAGNLTRAEKSDGTATTYSYNDDGQQVSSVDPRGNVTGATPSDYTTSYGYDPAGNKTTVTDPLGHTTTTSYNEVGAVRAVEDAQNHSTTYGYDSMGHVNAVTNADGATTQYAYNKLNQLVTLTTALNQPYTYTYDSAGRLKTVTTPEGKVTTYSYDLDGDQTNAALPAGSIATTYDVLGRPTKTDYSDTTPDVTTTYDQDGRPVTIASPTSTATYTYDPAGRTTGISQGTGQDFNYSYNTAGLLSGRTLPDGRGETYSYNDNAQLATLTLTTPTAGNTAIGYTYTPTGQLATTSRDSGPTTADSYDHAGNLTGMVDAVGSTTLRSQSISYDPDNRPATVATTRGSTTTADIYTYDDAGQLTGDCRPTSGTTCSAGSPGSTYGYDLDGNRTSTAVTGPGAGSTTYTYNHDDQLTSTLTGVATTSYTYDANGRLATQVSPAGTRTYDYGLDGNLYTSQMENGDHLAYTYDQSGDRLTETLNSTATTSWQWDQVGAEPTRVDQTGTSGSVTDAWWADPENSLGTALADTTPTTGITWLLTDCVGSITDTANGTALTSSTRYDPFGAAVSGAGTVASQLGFQGQYQDPTTGLDDLRARDYNAALGRFAAADPILGPTQQQSGNAYTYAGNMPTVTTDPSGMMLIADGGGGPPPPPANPMDGRYCAAHGLPLTCDVEATKAQLKANEQGSHPGWKGGTPGDYGLPSSNDTLCHGWFALACGGALLAGICAIAEPCGGALVAAVCGSGPAAVDTEEEGEEEVASVWSMPATARGLAAEEQLGGNLPAGFPVIDQMEDGVANSIKTIDVTAKTYNTGNGLTNVVRGYINKVAGFNGATFKGERITSDQITGRALTIGIESGKVTPSQALQFYQLVKLGQSKGVDVRIVNVP